MNYLSKGEAPTASKINGIDIKTATDAEWVLIYSFIERATTLLAVTRNVFDRYLIEETVGMAAEKAFKYRSCFNPAFSLTTWLSRIIRNTLTDNLNAYYDSRKSFISITDNEGNLTIDPTDEDNLPGNDVKALNMIYNYLDGLNEEDRTIMVWTLNGFSSAKIAKEIHKTENAVNIAKCRIRKKIRQDMRDSVLEVLFQTA